MKFKLSRSWRQNKPKNVHSWSSMLYSGCGTEHASQSRGSRRSRQWLVKNTGRVSNSMEEPRARETGNTVTKGNVSRSVAHAPNGLEQSPRSETDRSAPLLACEPRDTRSIFDNETSFLWYVKLLFSVTAPNDAHCVTKTGRFQWSILPFKKLVAFELHSLDVNDTWTILFTQPLCPRTEFTNDPWRLKWNDSLVRIFRERKVSHHRLSYARAA